MKSDIIGTIYLIGVVATFLVFSIAVAYADRQTVLARRKRDSERKDAPAKMP
ncbi:hypothetical protein PY365_23415 [Roseiarcaceae bacterium H3SJ34-1]|uniref:hypothetical protein n=1 Tax=Terripilifer ovatus TaxID=3032367 RepID=UPI003AB9B300|nr:hypothetical protein [Roseiarcaceae bacterium H3SJ34-1]